MAVSVSARKFTSCLAWWGGRGGVQRVFKNLDCKRKKRTLDEAQVYLKNNCTKINDVWSVWLLKSTHPLVKRLDL